MKPYVVVDYQGGEMTPGPRVRWGWCGPAGEWGPQLGEWALWRKGVEIDLQWVQVAELWEPCQELSDLEGCRPHIPRGQIRGMSGTAKEVGNRVVHGVAIETGGVIDSACGVTVELEPRAMAGTELGEGAVVWPWYQFSWVNWRGGWP